MTIPNTVAVRILNERLSNLEQCARLAKRGEYDRAKEATEAVSTASQCVIDALRDHGFTALNDDRLRIVEAVIYGYLLAGNPNENELIAAEGFAAR